MPGPVLGLVLPGLPEPPEQDALQAFTPLTPEADLGQDTVTLVLVAAALGSVVVAVRAWPDSMAIVALGGGAAVASGVALWLRLAAAWPRFTPDRAVAGIMVAGMLCVAAGFVIGGNRYVGLALMPLALRLMGAGAVLFVLGLAVGLVWAMLPDLVPPRVYRGVFLLDRYGLDERHMIVGDHPCPWDERMRPVVRFRSAEGSDYTLLATPSAYEFFRPGSKADVRVRKNRVVEVTVRS